MGAAVSHKKDTRHAFRDVKEYYYDSSEHFTRARTWQNHRGRRDTSPSRPLRRTAAHQAPEPPSRFHQACTRQHQGIGNQGAPTKGAKGKGRSYFGDSKSVGERIRVPRWLGLEERREWGTNLLAGSIPQGCAEHIAAACAHLENVTRTATKAASVPRSRTADPR